MRPAQLSPYLASRMRVLRQNKARQPLRSLKELAAEFGASTIKLGMAIKKHGGPQPSLAPDLQNQASHQVYYDHAAMRAWWATIKEKLNA